ncbi:hypothetical protein CR205_12200 [Alteribacter lacisalsi]|uniref:YolD-like family protein n=1 Tax=Alteribacter lacisalsi TaxID=2045244 RepID=A0A2W0HGC8_9BACI|nr:YolD-like family protein [Alteribacter lacisalsi]PYZ96475.1 hypothetical protein CR205_12200 [Alteribacter lacisalsi]
MNEKDRGTIKWTSLMLPEHVRMLKEHQEAYFKVARPELDPQQLEEFERTVCEAMGLNRELAVTYWENGYHHQVYGYVHYINYVARKLHVATAEGDVAYLMFDSLTDVRFPD